MRGGIVLRAASGSFFVPATVARELRTAPEITRILGAPEDVLGVALTAGEVVPVVRIGVDRRLLLLCSVQDDLLGVVGFEGARAGLCPEASEGTGVSVDGQDVPELALVELRDLLVVDRWSTRGLGATTGERKSLRNAHMLAETTVSSDRASGRREP